MKTKLERRYVDKLNGIVDQIFDAAYERGWNGRELANRSLLHRNTIRRIETHRTRLPLLRTVWRMAGAAGLEITFAEIKQAVKRRAG